LTDFVTATLVKAIDREIGHPFGEEGATFDTKTLDEGTATHVVAAFDTRLGDFNGAYLENANLTDNVYPVAKKAEDVEKLWKLSEKLVGQEFQY
jgi:hypothetical protein